jgi:hypothetical protein
VKTLLSQSRQIGQAPFENCDFYSEVTGDGEPIFLSLHNNASIHWPQEIQCERWHWSHPLRKGTAFDMERQAREEVRPDGSHICFVLP